MINNFSISTVAYSGYSIEVALDSIHSLGIKNIELAMIQGAVYDLDEETLNESNTLSIRQLLDERQMSCTSLAAHCHMTLNNCNELLLKRINLSIILGCPRVILYAPRDGSISQFQQVAKEALHYAETNSVQILIENVGDQQPYMLNDSSDFKPMLDAYSSKALGINFDPGNLASHRPNNNLLECTIQSLEYAQHIHIKDLILVGDDYQFCAIGAGICRYEELFQQISTRQNTPFFSIEAPFALTRKKDGKAMLKPREDVLSLQEINSRLQSSIDLILNQT